MQLDNSTFEQKAALRARALIALGVKPVVIETHGGFGRIFSRCYSHVSDGIVFETDPAKADALAIQRPSWGVYQTDSEIALADGVGAHLEANVLDCDPYGEPWPVIEAFFSTSRPFARRMVLVVNDGLRHKTKLSGGWNVHSMQPAVEHFGNVLGKKYLEVCEWMVRRISARVGYRVTKWTGYYCGKKKAMTHYAALLER